MGRYLGDPEQRFRTGAGAEATARGYQEGPWCRGPWIPRQEGSPECPAGEGCAGCVPLRGLCAGRWVWALSRGECPPDPGRGGACLWGARRGADSRPRAGILALESVRWGRNSPPEWNLSPQLSLACAGMTKRGILCQ